MTRCQPLKSTRPRRGLTSPCPTWTPWVRMKLTSFRLKDKVRPLDLPDIALIDESWCGRFHPEIGARLAELIDERHREA